METEIGAHPGPDGYRPHGAGDNGRTLARPLVSPWLTGTLTADATDYGFTLAAGYPGVTAFLSGVNGRVWDDEQGRVRLELQATRDAATVQQTYRETGAGGIQIAPPRSLTKPFGISQ